MIIGRERVQFVKEGQRNSYDQRQTSQSPVPTHRKTTLIKYNVYAVLPMKNNFITALYKLT